MDLWIFIVEPKRTPTLRGAQFYISAIRAVGGDGFVAVLATGAEFGAVDFGRSIKPVACVQPDAFEHFRERIGGIRGGREKVSFALEPLKHRA